MQNQFNNIDFNVTDELVDLSIIGL